MRRLAITEEGKTIHDYCEIHKLEIDGFLAGIELKIQKAVTEQLRGKTVKLKRIVNPIDNFIVDEVIVQIKQVPFESIKMFLINSKGIMTPINDKELDERRVMVEWPQDT